MADKETKAVKQSKVQEQIDLMQLEKAKIELEMAQLSLEDLKYRVEKERARRHQLALAHKAQQDSLDDFNEKVKQQQAYCKHRKGGKNLEGILKGHDSNYSVIQNTYPWGETVVMCTRCCKEWREGVPFANPPIPRTPGFETAIEWPTDNEPSGTQLFLIQKNPNYKPPKAPPKTALERTIDAVNETLSAGEHSGTGEEEEASA
ncbi:MAG TPA: hypothetical protein VMT22_03070 [Terriglobales bacterium]|nr:hypothetical protein [Terriglobales bacterium]